MKNSSILGTFRGECADANITNLNGLDITREVWENVFASDEYKKAIELGHYIGYLGHPEDPGCQDFEHACIVMTDGYIEDNGKVYGEFNLINTPVGKIVKSFIDGGVTFGISVRGAGDIINNSVDPDTFVFRGFDLVAFPAYPESIPEFSEIAASSDAELQKKYKIMCSTIRDNIESINTKEAVDILQSKFAKQSEEYKILEKRRNEICEEEAAKESEDIDTEEEIDDDDMTPNGISSLSDQKIEAMTQLYLDAIKENRRLISENRKLKKVSADAEKKFMRKLNSVQRITSSQILDTQKQLESVKANYNALKRVNIKDTKQAGIDTEKYSQLYSKFVKASKDLKDAKMEIESLNNKLESSSKINLKYKERIQAAEQIISEKESEASEMRDKWNETVKSMNSAKTQASNLDDQVERLKDRINASEQLIQEYQDAYASLYANAVGTNANNITVTASTSVSELRKLIASGASSSSIYASSEPQISDISDYNDDDIVVL